MPRLPRTCGSIGFQANQGLTGCSRYAVQSAGANYLHIAVTWEDTELQADLTMGNLVSALTLQSEEAALIAELQAGSEQAFAWLIAHYHQPIYSLLARTVHDRADAADLTQEVFV